MESRCIAYHLESKKKAAGLLSHILVTGIRLARLSLLAVSFSSSHSRVKEQLLVVTKRTRPRFCTDDTRWKEQKRSTARIREDRCRYWKCLESIVLSVVTTRLAS